MIYNSIDNCHVVQNAVLLRLTIEFKLERNNNLENIYRNLNSYLF